MFVNFKDFAGIGVIASVIVGFLVLCGMLQAAPLLFCIVAAVALAVYFGNK